MGKWGFPENFERNVKMKTITKKIMTLSILSVIALSAMTTTVSAQNNSINVNDVTETNTVVEYNPLGYDWEEFFL